MSNILYDQESIENWNEWLDKRKQLIKKGLDTGHISIYSDDLIIRLRRLYNGGIPASIILLSDYLSNCNCLDNASLLARAFFDDKDTKDINLVKAKVNSIRLNPVYKAMYEGTIDEDEYDVHYVLERITNDGKNLIYDTSAGYVYDYETWEALEQPEILGVIPRPNIISIHNALVKESPEDYRPNTIAAVIVLPEVETRYDDTTRDERYIDLLKREVEAFKKAISYDKYCEKNKEQIKQLRYIFKQKDEQ